MNAAVVIPIYKPRGADLRWYESISLRRCLEVFGDRRPIVFVAPNDRAFDYLPSGENFSVETFEPTSFNNQYRYNLLMTSPQFYKRFRTFDYILICQLDAFVFSDRLDEFCALDYDYIGAPWPLGSGKQHDQHLIVGNGGFSLRRVRACVDMLKKNAALIQSLRLNEDSAFSYVGKVKPNEFRVAPIRTASRFAVEILPEYFVRRNHGALPFGCHAWYKYSADFYVRTLAEFGYDLTPFAHLMKNSDHVGKGQVLRMILTRRLNERLVNARTLMKYLPSDGSGEKFSILLANERSKLLADRLRREGLSVAAPHERARVLLLSLTDDSEIVATLLKGGKVYGRDFLSFWSEYKRSEESLLRRISHPAARRRSDADHEVGTAMKFYPDGWEDEQ